MDKEVHNAKLNDHLDDTPTCHDASGGKMPRLIWERGPQITYNKSTHQIQMGKSAVNFVTADEAIVTGHVGDDKVSTIVYFSRINSSAMATLVMQVVADNKIVCADVYWFIGSWQAL
jgi:hypothetical protein